MTECSIARKFTVAGVMATFITLLFATTVQAQTAAPASPSAATIDSNEGFAVDPWGAAVLLPISVDEAERIVLELDAENLYSDDQRRQMIDLLEQDYANLSVYVKDESGRPVVGAKLEFHRSGTSKLIPPRQISARETTDESGVLNFAVIGGQIGLDRITVSHGSTSVVLFVNLISLRAAGFPAPPEIDGVIPWIELMSARFNYVDDKYSVNFPPKVAASSGERVKLSGFMVPLDPDLKQSRFLLTSNPPSCFYHIPGGPAGAVEVLTATGIETSWDPIVVEGRFETLQSSQYGVIYRLHDAKVIEP